MSRQIYVLSWRYHDGSAHGVVQAYFSQHIATAIFTLMREHADGKEWALDSVEVIEYEPELAAEIEGPR